MIQYFLKPFKNFGGNINVRLNLSNYATNNDLKILFMLILETLH